MNRRIVYTAQIPLSADFLQAQKDALQAIGQLAQDVMTSANTPALLVGLPCTPTNPPSMTVNLGPGSVYQSGATDSTAFGSIPSDSTPAFQQAFSTVSQVLGGFTPPAAAGQSIAYLIQVQFQQVDARPISLPYFNSANPQVPLVGPGGNGTPQNTDRLGQLAVQVVAGAAATTGNQIPPPISSGWLPAYVITVASGQTTIGSVNITTHPQAPFLASLTSSHHLGLPGTAPKIDLGHEVQGTLPAGVGFAIGQGLTRAGDGTIIPDYAGTGTATHPAHSDHTHANDATIGGPYQAQGNYQPTGNYSVVGHHHAPGDVDNVPWLSWHKNAPKGAAMIQTGTVTLNIQNNMASTNNIFNWVNLGFSQTPIVVATAYEVDDGAGIYAQAFAIVISDEGAIAVGQMGILVQSVPAGFSGQITINWIAIGN